MNFKLTGKRSVGRPKKRWSQKDQTLNFIIIIIIIIIIIKKLNKN